MDGSKTAGYDLRGFVRGGEDRVHLLPVGGVCLGLLQHEVADNNVIPLLSTEVRADRPTDGRTRSIVYCVYCRRTIPSPAAYHVNNTNRWETDGRTDAKLTTWKQPNCINRRTRYLIDK